MIDSLADQLVHGTYARQALVDAENMMARIARWDLLFDEERARERAKGAESVFWEVPGFEPRYCAECRDYTYHDYREDGEGECETCIARENEMKEAA